MVNWEGPNVVHEMYQLAYPVERGLVGFHGGEIL